MWNFFLFLFLSLHLTKANIVDDVLLTDEAIQLLQIDFVSTLRKNLQLAEYSLRKREQEVQTTKAELEKTKRDHATRIQRIKSRWQNDVEKSWTLVSFMMKVLKKVQGAAKAREELVVTQAAMLKQLKVELDKYKENIGDEVVRADEQNWGVLEQCQDVLRKQSSSLDLLKTIASERVTRNNSLRFTEDDEGHIVSAGFCQCIPDPQEHFSSTEVSLSLVKDEDGWLPTWSPWKYDPATLKPTRRKLLDLDAEHWEEDVEESSLPWQCLEHNMMSSATRRSTYTASITSCDHAGGSNTSSDWVGTGWYRVTGEAGTKLFESPVRSDRCGGSSPGWLTGGHPTVAEGEVTRTAKFASTSHTTSIKVINCNTHYVYLLEKVPACNMVYCTT